jgi:hypothetical protein
MRSLNLVNGIATLTINMPQGVEVGTKLDFSTKIADDIIIDDFENKFTINVSDEKDYSAGGDGKRKHPTSDDKGENESEGGIALPNISCVNKDEWDSLPCSMNEETALVVIESGTIEDKDNTFDYYLNMDNKYYLTELKSHKTESMDLLKAKYKYSMAIIGMSIVSYYQNSSKNNDTVDDDQGAPSIQEATTKISSIIAPVLLPMIEALGNLDETQIQSDTKNSVSEESVAEE